jgi:hypothetical protein
LKYIPLENIGILEGPPPSVVGAEIYGAGWTFRAYLLWEALGRSRDRDVMLLNLDSFDERRQAISGRWDLRFIAFNPTSRAVESELVFPLALERPGSIAQGSTSAAMVENRAPLTAGRCPIMLEPNEARWINVVVPA